VTDEVAAAGGVVVRDGSVALVHRPKYQDWSLPKGKLEPGEGFEEAALREVEEETGLRCRLVREVESSRYRDPKGRDKLVRYWLMEVVEEHPFEPTKEVDEVRWAPAEDAGALLSHPRDAEIVRGALASAP
jgi:8-oxo-dGTP diphosphatase